MMLAKQLAQMGTENAFEVSAQAAAWQARGNRVYPFHLGDISLMPPDAIVSAVADSIRAGKNTYCPGAGIPLLREQLARQYSAQTGATYTADNIAVQPGGKPVIAKFLQAVMNPGDEVLYPVPGFPIYRSQIAYQGGAPVPYYYHATADGYAPDMAAIRKSITDKTRAIIYNNYHNPTGAAAKPAEMDELAAIIREHNLWVLNDDAYFLIRYTDAPAQSILTRDGIIERAVNLFTFSKQFAMTGWRVGAAIAPAEVIQAISKMNTNLESCTTHFIQHAIGTALANGGVSHAPLLAELKKRRDALLAVLNDIDGISIPAPESAFYLYFDLAAIMRRKGFATARELQVATLEATGASFCLGEHFGAGADDTHARFAFSGISVEDIAECGAELKRYFESD